MIEDPHLRSRALFPWAFLIEATALSLLGIGLAGVIEGEGPSALVTFVTVCLGIFGLLLFLFAYLLWSNGK